MFNGIQDVLYLTFPNFINRDLTDSPSSFSLNQKFNLINSNQKPLTFTPQDENMPYLELGYEERIFHHGLIATRSNNWHDFFNAMIWHKFPKTKIAINAIHHQEVAAQTSSLRSRKRDLLTLFDECGVIIIADDEILELIRQHKWRELFVVNKQLWTEQKIQIITFGHAMYEKYLNPYIGMTAQALLLSDMLLSKTGGAIDNFLSKGFFNKSLLQSKAELSPLPLLGIPLWHKKQNDSFYANSNYFR